MPLDKTFDFQKRELEIQKIWEEPRPPRDNATAYTVILPPPNVTGNLHLGHALNTSLQDCMMRYHHMRGYKVLWQPGTDHAGIATQTVVERNMAALGKPTRQEMGKKAFLQEVWNWKSDNSTEITKQLRSLGAFCNWERERFTLDEDSKIAVRKVFVRLFEQRLITQGKRMVNWDPHFQTAISDLEVEHREIKGKLHHIQYQVEDSDEPLVIATTRPETIFADVAIAVHPDDPKYPRFKGKFAILPLLGRRIPIIADPGVNPAEGTGCLKVTPGHDFHDYEIGKKHALPTISILDNRACLASIPAPYGHLNGLNIPTARRRILELLDDALLHSEDHTHSVPHGDRSGVMLEPRVTKQWFLDMEPLADQAVKAVHEGKLRFSSQQAQKVFLHFLENIEPWCISRQLWWGHEIPVWHDTEEGKPFCAMTEEEAQTQADAHYNRRVEIQQDPDVLDTWFSSALWPMVTLDWDTDKSVMEKHYPTDALVTGKDILFFWVARMAMMGLHLTRETPFREVITHSIVRDEQGRKMSKSKGNVVDPISIAQKYSTDALRWFLLSRHTPHADLKYSVQQIEGARNFCTKLWNAARFLEMNDCTAIEDYDPKLASHPIHRWINHEILLAEQKLEFSFSQNRPDMAAYELRCLVKDIFCDWYLEFSKTLLDNMAYRNETQANLAYCMQQILAMAHPFIPFITEAIWNDLELGKNPLIHSPWPRLANNSEWELLHDKQSARLGRGTIEIIERIRSLKDDLGIAQGEKSMLFLGHCETMRNGLPCLFRECGDLISRASHTQGPMLTTDWPENSAEVYLGTEVYLEAESRYRLFLEAGDHASLSNQLERVEKQISKHSQEIQRLGNLLKNPEFQQKSPPEVFQGKQKAQEEAQIRLHRAESVKAIIVKILKTENHRTDPQ